MLQKKICMLGAFSVGKTSLVKQFVSSMFDEKYLTTLGVKIDKKVVSIDKDGSNQDMKLMLWDLAGEDTYNSISASYLRGSAGCIIVVDGTRPKTLEAAGDLIGFVNDNAGDIPVMIALNKADIRPQWELDETDIQQLKNTYSVLETSAKSGANVDKMFTCLAEQML